MRRARLASAMISTPGQRASSKEQRAKTWSESPPPSVWVAAGRNLALVVEQPIEHMRGFAGGRRDHLGVERRVSVGEVRVELDPGFIAVMGIDAARFAAEAAGPKELAIRGGGGAAAKHRRKRLALLLVDQTPERQGIGLVPDMPVRRPGPLAKAGDAAASAIRVMRRLSPSARRLAMRICESAAVSPVRRWVKQSVNSVHCATSTPRA